VLEDASQMVEQAPPSPVIVVACQDWHPGVVGIVAGRLRERYRKPAIVIGVDPVAGVGKGSGRSQPGVNLGRAVQAAFEEGLLLAGGGHAMAAGVTVEPHKINDLQAFLCARLGDDCARAADDDAVEIDVLSTPRAMDRRLFNTFQQLAPFGPGNPEPMFALDSVLAEQPMTLRGGHVRCLLTDGAGGRIKAVAWRAGETELGRRLTGSQGALHVAGRLKSDDFNGREGVELEIEDVADPRMNG